MLLSPGGRASGPLAAHFAASRWISARRPLTPAIPLGDPAPLAGSGLVHGDPANQRSRDGANNCHGPRASGASSISPFLVIQGARVIPISWPTAMARSSAMDPSSFIVLLIMATFTLFGGSILLGFLVMERNPAHPSSACQRRPATRRRARTQRKRL